MTVPRVRAVLWDADGVLQHSPDGWLAALHDVGGPGFAEALWEAEQPALRGEVRLRDALEQVLARWPSATVGTEDLLRFWERAWPDTDAMALVDEVRASGVTCALATNQQDHRRAWMRDTTRMDDHFDRVFYSTELRLAKPDPAYFRHILAELGVPAAETAFVDDSAANVEAARSLGVRTVHHDPASGATTLRVEVQSLLAER